MPLLRVALDDLIELQRRSTADDWNVLRRVAQERCRILFVQGEPCLPRPRAHFLATNRVLPTLVRVGLLGALLRPRRS